MKLRIAALALATAVALPITPASSPASISPSSLTLRWGAGAGLSDWGFTPGLSATWSAGSRLALWSSVSYMRETTQAPLVAASTAGTAYPIATLGGDRQTQYIPLALGVRAYAQGNAGRRQGLFLEAGPACTIARYWTPGGDRRATALAGLETGAGVRLPASRGGHAELGFSYYLGSKLGANLDAVGGLGRSRGPALSVFALYAAIGLGD